MNRIITFLCALLITATAFAQQGPQQVKGKISGKIIDASTGTAVEYATVALINAADSSIINGTITNAKGDFNMDVFGYGTFNVKIDFISYKSKQFNNIEITESKPFYNLGQIKIDQSSTTLSEVEVQAEKGQIQMGLDKKTFNVSKDLTTVGGTASDVLQNIPSVAVDMDGGVSLRGSSNVRILVDGKPSNLTGMSKANILEQLPASTIESVEVITNPSAKYDAEGMAGIINIITKKQKKSGLNGLFSISGSTNNSLNTSVNLNYGHNQFNFFGGYDFRYYNMNGIGETRRITQISDTFNYLNQDMDFNRKGLSNTIRGGVDYIIDDKNSLTFSVLYRISNGDNTNFVDYQFLNNNKAITSYFVRDNIEDEKDNGADITLSYKRNLAKKGQSFTADIFYSTGEESELTDMSQLHYDAYGNVITAFDPIKQFANSDQFQKNFTAQADYVEPIGEKGKLEAGWKSNIKTIDVDYLQTDWQVNEWVKNTNLSNHFIYDEQIQALYGTYSNSYESFSYQLGLRAEHTITYVTLENNNTSHRNSYTGFFPSIFVAKDLEDKSRVQVSYSRRINRPGFWSLNPFMRVTDPYNRFTGNPFLEPEKTNAFEAGYIKYLSKGTLSGNIYYRSMSDVITRIRQMDGEVAVLTFENISDGYSFGAEVVAAGSISKMVRLNGSINLYKTVLDAGDLGDEFDANYFSYMARLSANVTPMKGFDIQFMINYRGPSKSNQGKIYPFFFSDLAFKKDVLKQRASVGLRVSDLFNTLQFKYDTTGEGIEITGLHKRQTRAAYLTFTYKLNNYKFRERKSGDYQQMDDMGF